MEDYEDDSTPRDPVASGFGMAGLGLLAASLWLPWHRYSAGLNLIGYALMFRGLSALIALDERFRFASWAACVAGVLGLIDAAAGAGFSIYRVGFQAELPATLQLRDYALGGAIWLIAGGVIAKAAAKGNIAMRDAAAGRRDLFLMALVAEGLVLGPLMLLVSTRTLPGAAMSALAVAMLLFRFATGYLWMILLQSAAKGFEPGEESF